MAGKSRGAGRPPRSHSPHDASVARTHTTACAAMNGGNCGVGSTPRTLSPFSAFQTRKCGAAWRWRWRGGSGCAPTPTAAAAPLPPAADVSAARHFAPIRSGGKCGTRTSHVAFVQFARNAVVPPMPAGVSVGARRFSQPQCARGGVWCGRAVAPPRRRARKRAGRILARRRRDSREFCAYTTCGVCVQMLPP